jgi:hypothetical protein
MKKKSKKKVIKKVKKTKPTSEIWFRVDLEIPLLNSKKELEGYTWAEYTPRRGTDEQMAKALAENLKRMGTGGRLVELDGTPEGKIVESWAGVGRVGAAATIENQRIQQSEEKPA